MARRFNLKLFGEQAGQSRVDASVVGRFLAGVSEDIKDVCRNIAQDDKSAGWNEKLSSCRIYVIGRPRRGSVEVPCEMEASEIVWGERSLTAYKSGLRELRAASVEGSVGDEELPPGFDYEILGRIKSYYSKIADTSQGFALEFPEDGGTTECVLLDRQLLQTVETRLASRPHAVQALHGHSIQGVLYELSDQHYDDPTADIKVEVDPHDGTHWVCHVPRQILGDAPLDAYFRSTVLMEGKAIFRARKPELHVVSVRIVDRGEDFEAELQNFVDVGGDAWKEVKIEKYMDAVRERE